jgi:hypothetical protein
MTTVAVQSRRGTTTEHATFTGLVGESTIDTTKHTVVVHDGSTQGGFPLQKELSSGQNIKTINGVSLLNAGDITLLTAIPAATTTALGGVKVDGTSIIVDGAGTITAVGGGSGGAPSSFSTFSLVDGELIVEHSSSFTLSLVNGEFIVEYT